MTRTEFCPRSRCTVNTNSREQKKKEEERQDKFQMELGQTQATGCLGRVLGIAFFILCWNSLCTFMMNEIGFIKNIYMSREAHKFIGCDGFGDRVRKNQLILNVPCGLPITWVIVSMEGNIGASWRQCLLISGASVDRINMLSDVIPLLALPLGLRLSWILRLYSKSWNWVVQLLRFWYSLSVWLFWNFNLST